MTPAAQRDFDVLVYGATGFTGSQAARYLARQAPASLRWAVAGRNADKLAAVSAEIAKETGATVPTIVCDSGDAAAVDAMVARTRVMLTTVGPYARYGQLIVEACVRHGTHYVDITGETAWVRGLIENLHAAAEAGATRIVPFCGYDSVPSDLGTLIAVDHLRRVHGTGCRRVKGFHRGRGGINGGTIASFLEMQDSGGAAGMRDPILLNPPGMRDRGRPEVESDPVLPRYDREAGCWAAPFVMGQINTRVVRRSAALAESEQHPYGRHFSYQEYWKGGEQLPAAEVAVMAWGQAAFAGAMALSPVRNLIRPLLPEPGTGPSEETMDNGFFEAEFHAYGDNGAHVRVTLSDRGDPGNRVTVKILCECALALALDAERLPGAPYHGGVLTPASAFGLVLRERLEAAGMTFAIEDLEPGKKTA